MLQECTSHSLDLCSMSFSLFLKSPDGVILILFLKSPDGVILIVLISAA